MAKNQKKSSTKEPADESGGWLSGFLADEGTFDRRVLWRLGSWGLGTLAAITLAILANQTGNGSGNGAGAIFRQDHATAADLARQSQQLQSMAKVSEREISRISSAIDTLNGDRDRLFARITVLEQGLDSVTGSIRQHAAQNEPHQGSPTEAALESVPAEPPLLPPPDFTLRTARLDAPRTSKSPPEDGVSSANAQPSAPAPIVMAVEPTAKPSSTVSASAHSSPASAAMQAKPEAASRPAIVAGDEPATRSGPDETSSVTPATTKPNDEREPHTRKDAGNKDAGNKDAQIVVASIPPVIEVPGSSTSPIHIPVPHTDFGVDLGSANSIKGLRALWRSVLRSEAKELSSLYPIIVLKEHSNGIGMQLRLVAGPLADAAAAARICAVLTENGRACEATVFEGQRLATNEPVRESGAAAATTKKPKWTSSRHRHSGRPARAEEPAPQPPPTPLTQPAPQPAFGSSSH
ncbi:hypothetical protein [Nitrobacter sp.]|uniref:hypothetical protein n=1 Tax=Nitrobacter sp. TaxID=29420 RepID=UPI003F64EC50